MNAEEAKREAMRQEWARKVAGFEEVERLKWEELKKMTEAESGRAFLDLCMDPERIWRTPERLEAAGMVEMQRIFQLAHDRAKNN